MNLAPAEGCAAQGPGEVGRGIDFIGLAVVYFAGDEDGLEAVAFRDGSTAFVENVAGQAEGEFQVTQKDLRLGAVGVESEELGAGETRTLFV